MRNEEITVIRRKLSKRLGIFRYEHTLSVSYLCIALAMKYGCDLNKAELAGLLHDCAKQFSDDTILQKCIQKGISITSDEIKAPAVLHAKYGTWIAEYRYQVTDRDVLDAILWHTTGKPNMSLLEKILYVADYIEPRRAPTPYLSTIRRLAFEHLDLAVYKITDVTLHDLSKKGSFVAPGTRETNDYYKRLCKEKKGETI